MHGLVIGTETMTVLPEIGADTSRFGASGLYDSGDHNSINSDALDSIGTKTGHSTVLMAYMGLRVYFVSGAWMRSPKATAIYMP